MRGFTKGSKGSEVGEDKILMVMGSAHGARGARSRRLLSAGLATKPKSGLCVFYFAFSVSRPVLNWLMMISYVWVDSVYFFTQCHCRDS
jgi:hypothetical protein